MELRNTLSALYLCLVAFTRYAYCQTGQDAKDLRTQLFVTNGYDYRIRPIDKQYYPIDVYVNFYLLNINGLDEVTETLKTTGFLGILWEDEFLKWDPEDYGNISYYYYPQNDVWKPDVALKNSYLDYKQLGVSSLNVKVYSNGIVSWFPFQVFQSTCSVDITYFPFDVQTCLLEFVAWSYTINEVNMMSGDKGIVLDEYESNPEWDVLDTGFHVEEESGEASIIFTLKMKRKPLYVLLAVVMPIIMLAVLNIFVFVLPCESGEKASYAITVFLAFVVLFTIVSSALPENSETVAILSVYVMLQTVQSTVISLVALLMIRYYSFDKIETPIPRPLIFLVRFVQLKSCRETTKRSNIVDVKETAPNLPEKRTVGLSKIKVVMPPVENTNLKDVRDPVNDGNSETEETWKSVIQQLDRVCFRIFSLIFVVSTVVFFVAAARSS